MGLSFKTVKAATGEGAGGVFRAEVQKYCKLGKGKPELRQGWSGRIPNPAY